MLQVRKNTFETNSSSTHSLIMCEASEYKLLEDEEAFLVDEKVVLKENLFEALINNSDWNKEKWDKYCNALGKDPESLEDLVEMIKLDPNDYYEEDEDEDEDAKHRPFDRNEVCTLDQFLDNEYLESFSQEYETKSGEKIIAFGNYGEEY